MAAYATSAEFMDKNVGVVLDALDGASLTDNTLVVFTSDHGYMLGEHGRFEKHCCYDPAIRTALLMQFPELIPPGRTTAAMVELIDILPTILQVCDVPRPHQLQGKSFLPLLRGEVDLHRNHAIIEYADNEEIAIRTERWKLIYTNGATAAGRVCRERLHFGTINTILRFGERQQRNQ